MGVSRRSRITSLGGQDVDSFEDLRRIVALRPGERADIVVEREGRTLTIPATIGAAEEKDQFGQSFRVGRIGVLAKGQEFEQVGVLRAIPAAAVFTVTLTRSMVEGLWQIITGRRSTEEIGGPLKMAQIAGQQATLGWFEFAQLIALFSINLGFINLLPVPMLDGGHLLFYAIEAVRRRPLSERAQDWAFRGGLALLLALLLFTTFNDLGSFGLWKGLGRLIG